MANLDEIENKCGFKCASCPYNDCILEDEEGIEEELPIEEKLTKCQENYRKNREKYLAYQRAFHEKHPEKYREYYERRKTKHCKNVRHAYALQARAQRRRRARTNFDYVQSMDEYDLAEFLAEISGKKDKDFVKWLNHDLVEGKLSERNY